MLYKHMKYIYIPILILFLFLVACEKMAENRTEKIIGVWQVVPITPGYSTWSFTEDQKVKRTVNDSIFFEGDYEIIMKQTRYYLYINNLGHLDGEYIMLKHNTEILILQRVQIDGNGNGAFLRREFVKL